MTNAYLIAAWGRTIVAAKSDHITDDLDFKGHLDRLAKIGKENKLSPKDIGDLVAFLKMNPVSFSSQPQQAVVPTFKGWWGGVLPLPWRKMDDSDIAKAVWSVTALSPIFMGLVQDMKEKDGDGDGDGEKGKKTAREYDERAVTTLSAMYGTGYTAQAIMLAETVDAIGSFFKRPSKEEIEKKNKERLQEFRKRRKEKAKEDPEYTTPEGYKKNPKTGAWETKVSLWSFKDDKLVDFTLTVHQPEHDHLGKAWSHSIKDLEYGNYEWACKEFDITPASKEEWQNPTRTDFREDALYHSMVPDLANWTIKNVLSMAVKATEGDEKARESIRAEVKKIVDDYPAHKKVLEKDYLRAKRKNYLKEVIGDEETARIRQLIKEDKTPATLWEKVFGDQGFGDKLMRAEKKVKEEKAVDESTRTYRDYVEAKKQRGGKPLSEEDWEIRYGKKASTDLITAWGRLG